MMHPSQLIYSGCRWAGNVVQFGGHLHLIDAVRNAPACTLNLQGLKLGRREDDVSSFYVRIAL